MQIKTLIEHLNKAGIKAWLQNKDTTLAIEKICDDYNSFVNIFIKLDTIDEISGTYLHIISINFYSATVQINLKTKTIDIYFHRRNIK